ncbi:MAG: DNA recombination protein RmuC [bacterium]
MELLLIVLLIIVICALVWGIVEFRRMQSEFKGKVSAEQSLVLLQQQMGHVRDTLDSQMEIVRKQLMDSGKSVEERLISTSTIFGDMKKEIGGLGKAAEQILNVGNDISSLQELLKSPKLRGGLGEYFLSQILHQVLPQDHFIEQHQFASGETVDAVIKLGDKLLPVDAKFPLENFRQMMMAATDEEQASVRKNFVADVKKHLHAIAGKYIVPEEGTYEFAFMYVPAENVYYELISGKDIYEHINELCFAKKVFLVSPSTLYAHLQIILLGLKGLNVNKNAKVILDRMAQLKCDVDRFTDDFSLIGKHMSNVRSKYDDAEKRLVRLTEKINTFDKS